MPEPTNDQSSQPKIIDNVNVYGQNINVHYKDGAPSPGGKKDETAAGVNKLNDATDQQTEIVAKKLDELADRIAMKLATHLRAALSETGGGGGGGTGDSSATGTSFREARKNAQLLETITGQYVQDLEKFNEEQSKQFKRFLAGIRSLDDALAKITEQTYNALSEQMSRTRQVLMNFASSVLSGSYAVDHFRKRIDEIMEMSSRRMADETDYLQAIFDGINNSGQGLSATFKSVKENIQAGGFAYATSGKSLREFGKSLVEQRKRMDMLVPNLYDTMTRSEADEILQDIYQQMVLSGNNVSMDDERLAMLASTQVQFLKEISKYTGKSLDELIKANKAPVTLEEALALGMYDEQQSKVIENVYKSLAELMGKADAEKFLESTVAVGGGVKAFEGKDFAIGYAQSMLQLKDWAVEFTKKTGRQPTAQEILAAIKYFASSVGADLGRFPPEIAMLLQGGPNRGLASSAKKAVAIIEAGEKKETTQSFFVNEVVNRFKELLDRFDFVKDIVAGISAVLSSAIVIGHTAAMLMHSKALMFDSGMGSILKNFMSGLLNVAIKFAAVGTILAGIFVSAERIFGGEYLASAQEHFSKIFDNAGAVLVSTITSALAPVLAALIGTMVASLLGLPALTLAAISSGLVLAADWMTGGEFSQGIGEIAGHIYDFLSWLVQKVIDYVGGLIQSIVGEGVKKTIDDTFNAVGDGVVKVGDFLYKQASDLFTTSENMGSAEAQKAKKTTITKPTQAKETGIKKTDLSISDVVSSVNNTNTILQDIRAVMKSIDSKTIKSVKYDTR